MSAKLQVIGLEGAAKGVVVEAQFNPKEISIDKSVPWQLQKQKGPGDLQYTGGEPKTMSLELMFDTFESGGDVQAAIDRLDRLSDVDAGLKRPPKVKVVCGVGGAAGMIPNFESVIESVAVKYTMFDGDGRPVRATVGLRFKEARDLKVGKPT